MLLALALLPACLNAAIFDDDFGSRDKPVQRYSVITLVCDTYCTTPYEKAANHGFHAGNTSIISVFDIRAPIPTVTSYKASWEYQFGEYLYVGTSKIPTTADAQIKLDAMIDAIKTARTGAYGKVIAIPRDLPSTDEDEKIESAYDVITKPQLRTKISEYLSESSGFIDRLDYLTLNMVNILGFSNYSPRITVTFPDGSKMDFRVSLKAYNERGDGFDFSRVPSSGISADKSEIPETAEAVVGTYYFENEADSRKFSNFIHGTYGYRIEETACGPIGEMQCFPARSTDSTTCLVTYACE